jgi:hypothetical protein
MAQEVASVVDDRVDSGVNPDTVHVPEVPQSQKIGAGLDLGVVLSAAYDSNVFLHSTKPTSDMVSRIAPNASYTKGDPTGADGAYIRAAYSPTAVIYAENSSANRIDHEAAIRVGWRGEQLQIGFSGVIQKLGDATADTGRQTDRLEFENEVRAAWLPREKIALELAAGNRQDVYSEDAFIDSSESYGEVAMKYAYSPKTQLGVTYQVRSLDVEDAPDQTTQRLAVHTEWRPRDKITVSLEAGGEHRKTEAGSRIDPVFEARLDWAPREGTGLYLTGHQREEASAFLAGQNYQVKGITAGVVQRLGGNWSARLDAGRETSRYSQVSGTGADGRNDRIWFIRPALEYKISDQSNLALYYRASENESSDADFGYRQTVAGIELNCQF